MKNISFIPSKQNRGTVRLGKTLLASAIALTINSGICFADEDAFTLEEIVVTARKRTESMQDVPVAVTAISKSTIDVGNLDSMEEFMELVPNVSLPQDGWTSADISIRGSGRSSTDEDPGVGINRDGVYIGGLLTSFSNFYDIEGMEVLRGPQAGLYGRNAVGGAINITSSRPSFDERNGYIDVQMGNKQRQEYRAATNLTLIDDVLAIRLSGLYLDQDEGFNRVENQDKYLDAHSNESARLRILYTPSDDLEFLTTIETFSADGNIITGIHAPNQGLSPLNYTATGFPSVMAAGVDVDDTDHLAMNAPLMNESEQLQFIQEVNWDVGGGTLTGIFSYRDTEAEARIDGDRTMVDMGAQHYKSNQESTYLEVRFDRNFGDLNITTGVALLDETLSIDQDYQFGGLFGIDFASWYTTGVFDIPLGPPGLAPQAGDPISAMGLTALGNSGGWAGDVGDGFPVVSQNDQELESVAIFLEANYAVSDALDVWFNIRYTEDTKSIDFAQNWGSCPIACEEIFQAFLGVSPAISDKTEETFENVSPGIGLNYTFSEDLMAYAKYVTGFKAGGFNSISGSVDGLAFEPEETEALEVGIKSQWWDNRMQFNAAAFYQERTDALVSVTDPALTINDLGVNAGEMEMQGYELDLSVMPLEGLTVSLAYGFLDAEFEDFITSGVDYSGNRAPKTFKHTLSGIVSYTYPLNDSMELFTFASYYTAKDGYMHPSNQALMDEPETVDIRIGVQTEDWKLSAYVDNAFDNRTLGFQTDKLAAEDQHWGLFSPGRTFGLQAVYNFH